MIEIYGRQVPTELHEIAAPGQTALVVIDMQNDLCSPDGVFAAQGADVSAYAAITPRIARLVAAAREARVLVAFVQATTRKDHATQSLSQLFFELRMQRSYPDPQQAPLSFCEAGTWGHQVLPELDCRDTDVIIEKHRSSAFVGTPLDLVLRSQAIRTVVAVGCTTEGCVSRFAPGTSHHDEDLFQRFAELIGEGLQVIEHASLVRGPVAAMGADGYTATRLGRAALERGAVDRIIAGGSL